MTLTLGVQGHSVGSNIPDVDQPFHTVEEQSHAIWDPVKNFFRNVLTEDKSDLQAIVKKMLSLMESSVCVEEGEAIQECDPEKDWLLGCECKSEFSSLGSRCSRVPCELVQYFKDDGPRIMRDFLAAKNFEKMFKVFMEPVERIWRILCECRSVVNAATDCAPHYDGQIFSRFGLNRAEFEKIVELLDWELVNEAVHGYLGAICGVHKGEDCLSVFNTWQVLGGTFLDNTFNGEDVCLSRLRAEDEVKAILESQVYKEGITMKSYIEGMIETTMVMEEKIICDADCAPAMQESYYFSCCLKRAGEALSSEDMKKKWVKLIQNGWSLVYPGDAPDLSGAVDRFMSMFRPAEFCGERTDVYKKFNDQCDQLIVTA